MPRAPAYWPRRRARCFADRVTEPDAPNRSRPAFVPPPVRHAGTTRRGFLAGVLAASAAGAIAACGGPSTAPAPAAPPAPDTGALARAVADIEQRHRVRLAVHARYRDRVWTHRAAEPFAMCSTFKTYASAAILRLAAEGALRLDDTVPVEPADIVVNSPITGAAQGAALSYAQLCEATLTRSDNAAANLLLRRIGGPSALTAFARTLGDQATRLERWEPDLNLAERGSLADTTTADGLARGYDALLLGDALPAAERQRLIEWMRASQTSGTRIRAGLPPGWSAADKTGGGRFGADNDAGVLWSPDGAPLLLVLLSDSTTGFPDTPGADPALAEATAAVVRELAG